MVGQSACRAGRLLSIAQRAFNARQRVVEVIHPEWRPLTRCHVGRLRLPCVSQCQVGRVELLNGGVFAPAVSLDLFVESIRLKEGAEHNQTGKNQGENASPVQHWTLL